MIIASIWARSLGSRVGVCLLIWHWSLVIREGALICWSLDLICGGRCSIDRLYISTAGSDILIRGWNLVRFGVIWVRGGKFLEIYGWTLVRQNLSIWIGGGSIVVARMIGLWVIGLVRLR